jgi:MATE family multidrug resistance protein
MRPITQREVLALALPAAATTLLHNTFRMIDQWWVQGLGTSAQAGLSASVFVMIFLSSVFTLMAAGCAPIIARRTGADEPESRAQAIGAALTGVALMGVVIAVLFPLLVPWIVEKIGLRDEAAYQAIIYLKWSCWTILPMVVAPVVDAAFLSIGDTRTPLKYQVWTILLNLVLTPFFIYQLNWGIAGAAIGTSTARAITVVPALIELVRRCGFRVSRIREEWAKIARVGAPVALNGVNYALAYQVLMAVAVTRLGDPVSAALGIGYNALEGVTWPVYCGLSLAISSLVGRRLGMGDVAGAKTVVRLSSLMTVTCGLVATVVFLLFGDTLTALFTEDPIVRREAALYAAVLAWSQLAVALEAQAEGVLLGAGATKPVFWWSAPFNWLRVPLCWFFAFPCGWGAAGVWWAINLTSFLKAFGKWWEVSRGRWADTVL